MVAKTIGRGESWSRQLLPNPSRRNIIRLRFSAFPLAIISVPHLLLVDFISLDFVVIKFGDGT